MKFFKRKKALLANIFVIIFSITTIIGIKLVNAAQNIPNLIISYEGTNIENNSYGSDKTTIEGKLNEEFEVKYKVTPQDILVGTSGTQKNIDISLVIDTSGSMGRYRLSDNYNLETAGMYNSSGSRFRVMQASATKFINSLSGKTNIKVGIVNFGNQASEMK